VKTALFKVFILASLIKFPTLAVTTKGEIEKFNIIFRKVEKNHHLGERLSSRKKICKHRSRRIIGEMQN
jgi:hypothetical protein